jgi:uncharacterized integral membrane protein
MTGRPMIRKVVAALVLLPLAAVIVLLAMANRQAVTISLDPFLSEKPAFALTQPLFLVILGAVVAGVVIGGAAAWLRQARWRRAARRAQAEARALRAETDMLKERLAATEPTGRRSILAYRRPPAA